MSPYEPPLEPFSDSEFSCCINHPICSDSDRRYIHRASGASSRHWAIWRLRLYWKRLECQKLLGRILILINISVLGLIIGAIFVEYTSWRWVFWFLTLITIPLAVVCMVIIPAQPARTAGLQSKVSKFKSLDVVGVTLLTGRHPLAFHLGHSLMIKFPKQ